MINHSRCLSGAFKWFRGQWGTSSLHRGKYQESGKAPDNCPEHRTKYKTFEAGKTFRVSDGEFEVGPYHAGRICKNRLAVVGFESES